MNRYYIVPIADLKEIDAEYKTRRMNADKTEILIHVETLDSLIANLYSEVLQYKIDTPEKIVSYPIIQGKELTELLSTPEWNSDNKM